MNKTAKQLAAEMQQWGWLERLRQGNVDTMADYSARATAKFIDQLLEAVLASGPRELQAGDTLQAGDELHIEACSAKLATGCGAQPLLRMHISEVLDAIAAQSSEAAFTPRQCLILLVVAAYGGVNVRADKVRDACDDWIARYGEPTEESVRKWGREDYWVQMGLATTKRLLD